MVAASHAEAVMAVFPGLGAKEARERILAFRQRKTQTAITGGDCRIAPILSSLTASLPFPIIHLLVGAWLSLVERSVRDREVGGSNPLAPTKYLDQQLTAANIGGRSCCVLRQPRYCSVTFDTRQ